MKLQVGAKVLIKNEEGNLLLLQRSEPLPDGTGIKWDIPGGRIDPSESLQDALKREVSEEIGLHLTATPKLLKAQDVFIPDIELHVVRLTYMITMSGEVTLSSEHQRHKWVSAREGLALNIDPYLHEMLEELVSS